MSRTRLLSLLVSFAAAAPALGAQAPAPDLSDPEVAHVAVTANTIDVELARLAQARAQHADVRRFAGTMIADHSAVNAQAAALAGRLGVTPAHNAVSQSLLEGAARARAALEGLHGAAFDRAYMDREVAYHQAVLDALDGLLIPTSANAELKKLLVDVRPAIAAHRDHAERIRNSLGSDAASPRTHTIEIRGMAYDPDGLTVARGDTVVWINRDVVPHTATGGGRLGWDTGQLLQGQEGRYVAGRAGEAAYTCALHPGMRATLIVQ